MLGSATGVSRVAETVVFGPHIASIASNGCSIAQYPPRPPAPGPALMITPSCVGTSSQEGSVLALHGEVHLHDLGEGCAPELGQPL